MGAVYEYFGFCENIWTILISKNDLTMLMMMHNEDKDEHKDAMKKGLHDKDSN